MVMTAFLVKKGLTELNQDLHANLAHLTARAVMMMRTVKNVLMGTLES